MSATLENRDYYLLIDKSGSMATADVNGRERWDAAKEGTLALTSKIVKYDPDGITVYPFAGNFRTYENVATTETVNKIFHENEPNGSTALDKPLAAALDSYFALKAKGEAKANGAMILVVTDGIPDDRKAVERVIIEATKKMDRDEELAISFIQIGKDGAATQFLKHLDDELQSAGAKFDIVDTVTQDEAEGMTFVELLEKALND